MRELAKLPNTGTAIESQLEPVGISTPEALRSVGGRRSWQRPYSNHRFIRYYNRLCALKGTLRDIRAWYDLERPIEEALKSFIRTIKNHDWGGFYEYNTLCLCSNRTVSYTHLDVYKRQELDDDSESIITNERYAYIAKLMKNCVHKKLSLIHIWLVWNMSRSS